MHMNEFFHFSLFERKGIGTLLVCLALITWLPRRWSTSTDFPDDIIWEEVPTHRPNQSTAIQKAEGKTVGRDSLTLTKFNPNTVSFETLTNMGFPVGLARGWVNYRAAGAHFTYREDVLRLYGMDSLLYTNVKEYIDLPARPDQVTVSQTTPPTEFFKRDPIIISINRASANDWAKLYGIGPVLSSRIVAFRDKLGGFSTVGQVAETFGLPDSTFSGIKDQLRLEDPPAQLPVNTLPAEQLAEHPYISWKQARAITNFRTNHGPFATPGDFQVLQIFSEEEHLRLEPYLDFTFRTGKRTGKKDSPTTVQ